MNPPILEFSTQLLRALRQANSISVLTGSGISAESGVPTFRDAQSGLWAQYQPEELATPQAFAHNPQLVWEWYAWRRSLIEQVQPNSAHFALVEMSRHVRNFSLITQNVDGLHQLAGSQAVIELHGNIRRTKCSREDTLVSDYPESNLVPPRCPVCAAYLRPDIVWFGENLPAEALQAAHEAARSCQVFFSIGTSGLVQPAASLPLIALEAGAVLVEVNPSATPLSPRATYILRGPAGSILPELVRAAWP